MVTRGAPVPSEEPPTWHRGELHPSGSGSPGHRPPHSGVPTKPPGAGVGCIAGGSSYPHVLPEPLGLSMRSGQGWGWGRKDARPPPPEFLRQSRGSPGLPVPPTGLGLGTDGPAAWALWVKLPSAVWCPG